MGSGSYYRFGSKDRVEDCLSLDARGWRRDGWLEPGSRFTSTWRRGGRQTASIGVRVLGNPVAAVELSYTVGSKGNREDILYRVPLSWTPCNFGGFRPWFLCPGVVNGIPCGRRVAILYGPGHYFLCRHCHDLSYESQNERGGTSALHKCRKIRRKLGGTANLIEPFPEKPKGMHHRTYWRLFLEYEKANDEYTRAMIADLERLTVRVFGGHGAGP